MNDDDGLPIKPRIKEGDTVTVVFQPDDYFEGVVLYMAQQTGDCWHIETENEIRYVQNFTEIRKAK